MQQRDKLCALGTAIRAARKAKGLTQEALAERCGFDPTYISMLENGQRNVPFLTMCNLAKNLELPLARLVRDIAN